MKVKKNISIVEAFVFSVETIKKHPLLILGPALVSRNLLYGISYLLVNKAEADALGILPDFLLSWYQTLLSQPIWLILLLLLVAVIIYAIFSIGLLRLACFAFDNQDEKIGWSVYQICGKRVLFLFVTCSFVLSLVGLIGKNPLSVLLNLIGLIIWILFLFTPFLLVEKNMSLEDALRTSYWMTRGIKVSLAFFFVSYSLIVVAIFLPLFFIFLWFGAHFTWLLLILHPILQTFLVIATVYLYKDVYYQEEHQEDASNHEDICINVSPESRYVSER